MKKLGGNGLRWLKIVHLLFVAAWTGGGLSLMLVFFAARPSGGDELYAVNMSLKLIDDYIIIPGANGCLLTGLAYGIWSNWGFFKHKWIAVKWIMTVLQIVFGTFWLGPWLNGNAAIAAAERASALSSPVYIHNHAMNAFWGAVQVSLLFVMVAISVLKPWKDGRKRQNGEKRQTEKKRFSE